MNGSPLRSPADIFHRDPIEEQYCRSTAYSEAPVNLAAETCGFVLDIIKVRLNTDV